MKKRYMVSCGLALALTVTSNAVAVAQQPSKLQNAANLDGRSFFAQALDPNPPLPPPPTPDDIDRIKKNLEEAARSGEANSGGSERSARVRRAAEDSAPKPNPALDFDSIKQDPENYRLPEAAYQWKSGDKATWADGDKITIPAPPPGGKALGNFDKSLEKYYAQKVTWGSCKPFGYETKDPAQNSRIECGYAIVPLDYSKPNGPTIAIGMLKVKSLAGDKKLGTVFTDPGGPGGSGMESAEGMIDDPITNKFDLIGFDPRGVGDSLPQIRCESSDATDKQRQFTDAITGPEQDKIDEYNVKQCYENTTKIYNNLDGFLETVGTVNVVNDLDVLRSVVGDKKLSYLGFSYGTKIGYRYAQSKANNIGALVLDGVVNPYQNNPELLQKYNEMKILVSAKEPGVVSQSRGFGDTFKQFIKSCLQGTIPGKGFDLGNQPSDCALREGAPIANPTPEQIDTAYNEYLKLARKAWNAGGYEKTKDGRVVSFSDFTQGTILAMYSDHLWQYLRDSLLLAKKANNAFGQLILADNYAGRDRDGKYNFEQPAFGTISCMDEPRPDGTPSDDRALIEEIFKVSPFRDPGKDPKTGEQRGIVPTIDTCHFYKDHEAFPKGEELQGIPNVLAISSSYDPATPYGNGVVAAMGLHGTLLSVANNAHCAYGKFDCSTNVTLAYLENPEQFLKDVKAGKFEKGEKYTGATPVATRHIYSDKDVQGNTCQLDYYGPEAEVQEAGKTVTEIKKDATDVVLKGTKVAPNQEVTFRLKDGTELGKATADKDGNVELKLDAATLAKFKDGLNNLEMVQDLNVYPFDLKVNTATTSGGAPKQPSGKDTPDGDSTSTDTSEKPEYYVLSLMADEGEEVTVQAKDFAAGQPVEFFLDGKKIGEAVADANGNVSFTFTVPADTKPGDHEIKMVQGEKEVLAKLTVKKSEDSNPSSKLLANTGFAGLWILLVGATLAAAGAITVARRKI